MAIRECHDLAHGELAVQFVESRRTEPPAEASPHGHRIGKWIQRSDARIAYSVLLVFKARNRRVDVARRAICPGRQAGSHERVQVVRVIVLPVIETSTQCQLESRCDRNEVLHEDTCEELGAARNTIDKFSGGTRRVHDRLHAIAIDPTPIAADRDVIPGPECFRPLHHATRVIGGHALQKRQTAAVPARRIRQSEKVAVEGFEVAPQPGLQIAVVGHADAHAAVYRLPNGVVGFVGNDDSDGRRALPVDAVL